MPVLFILATPIGNLADLSQRAKDCLESVDFILCEDTRHSKVLLDAFNINKKCISYFAHNEAMRCEQIIPLILNGQSAALISDAGTPAISDPGVRIVRACHEAGIQCIPIPGPSAVVAAISACGIIHDSFRFMGFFPRNEGERVSVLENHRYNSDLLVAFESPKRIISLLETIVQVLGADWEICLARELTKKFEEIIKMPAGLLLENILENPRKGEICILIAPGITKSPDDWPIEADKLLCALKGKLAPREIKDIVAKTFNIRPNLVYQKILENN